VSSRRDAVTVGLDRCHVVFRARAKQLNRSSWRVSLTAVVLLTWQAGQDSPLLFAGCGQQGDGAHSKNCAETCSAKDAVVTQIHGSSSEKTLRSWRKRFTL